MNYEKYKAIENKYTHLSIAWRTEFFIKLGYEIIDILSDEELDKKGIDFVFICKKDGKIEKFLVDFKVNSPGKVEFWNKYTNGKQDLIIEKEQYSGTSWISDDKPRDLLVTFVFPDLKGTKYKHIVIIPMKELIRLRDMSQNRKTHLSKLTGTYCWYYTLEELKNMGIVFF